MKYLILTFIVFTVLMFVAWQFAVFFIGLTIGLFKVFLVLWGVVAFICGYKVKGFLENHRKNRAIVYLTNQPKN